VKRRGYVLTIFRRVKRKEGFHRGKVTTKGKNLPEEFWRRQTQDGSRKEERLGESIVSYKVGGWTTYGGPSSTSKAGNQKKNDSKDTPHRRNFLLFKRGAVNVSKLTDWRLMQKGSMRGGKKIISRLRVSSLDLT